MLPELDMSNCGVSQSEAHRYPSSASESIRSGSLQGEDNAVPLLP